MKCLRCGGAMVYDKFYSSQECFWGLKCVLCGEIVDPVIQANRQLMQTGRGMNLPKDRKLVVRVHR